MNRRTTLLLLISLFLLGAVALFLPDTQEPRVMKFLILSQVLLALSLAIYFVGRRFDFEERDRGLFKLILLLALLARVIMFFGPGETFWLSDDVYRYIWDGKIATAGINPYEYPPNAPELVQFQDDDIYPKINHRRLSTIYPPVAQSLFATAYVVGQGNPVGFKIIAALFELLTLLSLIVWLKQMGVKRSNLLLYLFSPLVLIEFYQSTHIDICGLPFLVAAMISLGQKRYGWAGMLLALSALVKFNALLLVPVLFFHIKGEDRRRFAGAFALTVVACYAPYLFWGSGAVLGSLGTYLGDWQFNGSVFYVLEYGLEIPGSRYLVAGLFVGWLAYLIVKKMDIYEKMFRSLAGYLVLTPVFFPWYFVWIFPFIVRRVSWAFVILSGMTLLSYHIWLGRYALGEWEPIVWLHVLSYIPFYLLLIWPGRFRFTKG